MLFKVHYAKDFFELNPEAYAIEEFAERTSQQMIAVALIADYESPFRTLPEKERREKAAKAAGYKLEKDGKRLDINGRNVVDKKVPTIEKAIEKYREIQYDQQKDMLEAYDALIYQTIETMKTDNKEVVKKTTVDKKGNEVKEFYSPAELSEKAGKLAKSLPELKKARQEIIDSIPKDKDVVLDTFTAQDFPSPDDSDQPLSTLDMVMSKRINDDSER